MKINTIFKAGVLAAALSFAQLGHATNIEAKSAVLYVNPNGSIDGSPGYVVQPWTVHDTSTSADYLAFCVDFDTWADTGVTNYSSASTTPSLAVQSLYESSYSQVTSGGYDANKAVAFQLALWTITNPSKVSISAPGGDPLSASIAQDALNMISAASSYSGAYGHYAYTLYSSADSQSVMAAAAVPEAETWAMMAAGLGLVGLIGRRQKRNKAQNAA